MKLIVKTSRHYFWLSFAILILTGIVFFFILRFHITEEIREQLDLQTDMVAREIENRHPVIYPLIEISLTDDTAVSETPVFRDTSIYDYLQKEKEGYYYLSQVKRINGQHYRIKVMTTYIGWGEYLKTISLLFGALAILLVAAGIFVNYSTSKKVWQPFLRNLAKLRTHTIDAKTELLLHPSNIDEFENLNTILLDYSSRMQKQYTGLQEFTENASHELQTPIAVIRARLESMSQIELSQQAAGYLYDAKKALDRLSKVNKGLLLLAKLTHDAFPDRQVISLRDAITNQISELEELFESRQLKLLCQMHNVSILASPYLVDIMVSNLLSNIIRHSSPQASLLITLDADKIVFANTGEPLPFPEELLFTRFKKKNQSSNGIGLGLSIIRQICLIHGWTIGYSYIDGRHQFEIKLIDTAK